MDEADQWRQTEQVRHTRITTDVKETGYAMTSSRPILSDASLVSEDPDVALTNVSDAIFTTEVAIGVPEGCYTAFSDFVPWDNPNNLISTETVEMLEVAIYCGLMPLLCTMGLVSNLLSCAVFYRLGLKKGINLCLFLVSVSDTLFLVIKTMIRSAKVILIQLYGSQGASRWDYTVVTHGFLRKAGVFLFFSNFLTTLASVERCVSIISPLKARLIFSHSKMVGIIVFVFIVDLASFLTIGFKHKASCVFNVHENSIVWAITASDLYKDNTLAFNILDNFVLIIGFPVLSVTVMVVSTSLIILRLRQAARWRHNTSSSGGAEGVRDGAGVSKSEVQLYKMLVAMACVHVACTAPTIVRDISKFFTPGFNVTGHYSNLFNVLIAVKDTMASINCSVNFFIYYKLSVQFRHTLATCLGRQTSNKKDTTVSEVSTITATAMSTKA